ncbi:MAG: sugar transferase [Scytolyngbya sp. HA4215-MV1]|nr:sugar transferase [Scytolyngbya sp. HA4215-MV1]
MTKVTLLNLDEAAALSRDKVIPAAPNCQLQWRQGKLWVGVAEPEKQMPLAPLFNSSWLIDCLSRSTVEQIVVDPLLGEVALRFWAEVGQKTDKPVYLRANGSSGFLQSRDGLAWMVKRLLDRVGAALLLLLLSPLWLAIMGLRRLSPTPSLFTTQWRVGARGRLFQVQRFQVRRVTLEMAELARSQGDRLTLLKFWFTKFGLARSPELLQVVRGEMSLVGPRSLSLAESARLGVAERKRLRALPGLLTPHQEMGLTTEIHGDLEYLHHWSLLKDLEILLLAIPQLFWWSMVAISTVFSLTIYAS